jgi:Glycosyl transferase family 4
VLFLTVVLAGAIAGFLRYNFNPASIFLGDCGSLLIGFLLSGIAIAGVQTSSPMAAVACPVVSLGLPILDLGIAVIRRFLGDKRLFSADREHIHHKLLSLGVSHKQAVMVLYGASASFGICSLLLRRPYGVLSAMVIILVGLGVCIGLQRLRYREFLELGRAAGRALRQRRIIANGINVLRAVEVLNSCATLPQFCQILQQCLEPIGFDGFVLRLTSRMPRETDTYPFKRVSRSNLQFLWNQRPSKTETNWSLTFGLNKQNGIQLGEFSLYRSDASAPLWLDLDTFTAAGFSGAVGAIMEKMLDSAMEKNRRKQNQKISRPSPESLVASGVRRPIVLPSSGLSLDGHES